MDWHVDVHSPVVLGMQTRTGILQSEGEAGATKRKNKQPQLSLVESENRPARVSGKFDGQRKRSARSKRQSSFHPPVIPTDSANIYTKKSAVRHTSRRS